MDQAPRPLTRWRYLLREWSGQIWFRAALITVLAVLLALAGVYLQPLIPYELSVTVGGEAVDAILSILSSSMLAVTTFSLTTMVTSFSGASQQITPRAVHLLVEDKTAQNALSTFLGGFVFALVSIVALNTGIYGPQGRVILFVGAIGMSIAIVITLLRWIARLVKFGRVDDAIGLIEKKSIQAVRDYEGPILLAGRPETSSGGDGETAVKATKTGYVAHVDRGALSECAREAPGPIRLTIAAGDFVDPTTCIAWVHDDGEALGRKVRRAITVTRTRDFDQDPRFGMQVLSEIAIRALSPAVNDPGTAVQSLVAAQRVLEQFADYDPDHGKALGGLVEQPLALEEMVDELLLPVIRDGAAFIEVGRRVQYLLGALAQQVPGARGWIEQVAAEALERSQDKMTKVEAASLRKAHDEAFG